MRGLLGLLAAVGLGVAVYAPTFAAVSFLKLPIAPAVPVIIALTFSLALIYMLLLERSGQTLGAYGFRLPEKRYLLMAVAIAVPVGLLLASILKSFPEKDPLAAAHFSVLTQLIYFGLCAPIQEETIFRGLLQTVLARFWPKVWALPRIDISAAALGAALLFGLVHFSLDPFVAFGAFLLGLLAGELRRRSGSLLPGILAHAIFNLAEIVLV